MKMKSVLMSFTALLIIISANAQQTSSFKDSRDGIIYKTVKIGTQTWMAENLKAIKYNDGSSIPLVADSTAWTQLTTPGYCWYKNNESKYKNTYGALYNWYAVNTGKLCPSGWHMPTETEWGKLTASLIDNNSVQVGQEGGKLKEAGITHWETPNTSANNKTGFTALPGGGRDESGDFNSFFNSTVGTKGSWWSATGEKDFTSNAFLVSLTYDDGGIATGDNSKQAGLSVRCVKNLPGTSSSSNNASEISTTKTVTKTGTSTGKSGITTTTTSTTSSTTKITFGKGTTTGNAGTTKTETKTVPPASTTSTTTTSTVVSSIPGTVTDIDGNIYHIDTIGTQIWLVENLRTKHYQNGDPIPNVTDGDKWDIITTGAFCSYDNDDSNAAFYGLLYNWYAVADSRKLAPAGWHVPTDREWLTLTNFLGGDRIAGRKMKSTSGWADDGNGTNSSGFKGLPGGYREAYSSASSYYIRQAGYWWSSSVEAASGSAWYRDLENSRGSETNFGGIIRENFGKGWGVSVRCIKD